MSQACSVAYSSLVHLVAIEWPRVIDYSQDISEDVISIAVFLLLLHLTLSYLFLLAYHQPAKHSNLR